MKIEHFINFYLLQYIYTFNKDHVLLDECMAKILPDIKSLLLGFIVYEFHYFNIELNPNIKVNHEIYKILPYFKSIKKLQKLDDLDAFLHQNDVAHFIIRKLNLSIHDIVYNIMECYKNGVWDEDVGGIPFYNMCKLYMKCEIFNTLSIKNKIVLIDTIVHAQHCSGSVLTENNTHIFKFLDYKNKTKSIWDIYSYAKHHNIHIYNSIYITKNLKKITGITYEEYKNKILEVY